MYFQIAVRLKPTLRPTSALFHSQSSKSSIRVSFDSFFARPGVWRAGASRGQADRGIIGVADFNRQIQHIDLFAVAQNERVFDGIFQFAYISPPGMIHKNP